MKSIITSLGMIVFVAAVVAGGTGAFFSDTETSTGNVFTAGAVDLTVDSVAHYNGMICFNSGPNFSNGYKWHPMDTTVDWDGAKYALDSAITDANALTAAIGAFNSAPANVGLNPKAGDACDGTWEKTDLGAQKFFSFADIKPGDEGENTVSLHVNNNPAWACVDVAITENDDVSSTEPEIVAGDAQDNPTNLLDGELAQNLKFAAWLDQGNTPGWQNTDGDPQTNDTGEGDNVWQGAQTEPLLFSNQSGPASDVLGGKSYALADSTTGTGPMQPLVTNYIGLAWCAGTQTVGANAITCDGAGMGNIAQTDSMKANLTFRVEQARNNENFTCTPR